MVTKWCLMTPKQISTDDFELYAYEDGNGWT